MEPYLRYLYTYVSVSGPHLSYLYSSNSLFNSGLWLLKKLKGTQCIHQLTFTDDPDLQNTFLYKLCKVLNWYIAPTVISLSFFPSASLVNVKTVASFFRCKSNALFFFFVFFTDVLSAKDIGEFQEHYFIIFTTGMTSSLFVNQVIHCSSFC